MGGGMGLVGILAAAVAAAVRPEPSAVTAVLVGGGIALLAVRFAYLLGVDRRYAELLEQEVANQTRSLMDSLAAAATAERNLRLVMESVPDAITVLDREGRVTELNPRARAMMARQDELQPGSAFDSLDVDAAKIVRAKLAAAFQGEVQRFDLPFLRGDGTKGYSTVVYAPVRESGRVTRVLALARDVTDRNAPSRSSSRRRSSQPWGSSSAASRTRSTTPRPSFPASPKRCCSTS